MTADTSAFAAVDWGTSSFRLWLMADNGTVLAERRSKQGMLVAAQQGFADILADHLAAAGAAPDLPVVVCGMAGSRQGWIEARYLDIPVALSSIVENAVEVPGAPRRTFILPGLAQRVAERADVMRGEETQLLGAAAMGRHASGLFCMPGTHSKWVRIDDEKVTDFSTFMTGECFSMLAEYSILAHTVGDTSFATDEPAFAGAVVEGHRNPGLLTNLLFSVRARQLLFADTPAMSAARLSGYLIGAEMAGSRCTETDAPITLIVSGRLGALYRAAFAALDVAAESIDADDAVRAGLLLSARRLDLISDGSSNP